MEEGWARDGAEEEGGCSGGVYGLRYKAIDMSFLFRASSMTTETEQAQVEACTVAGAHVSGARRPSKHAANRNAGCWQLHMVYSI